MLIRRARVIELDERSRQKARTSRGAITVAELPDRARERDERRRGPERALHVQEVVLDDARRLARELTLVNERDRLGYRADLAPRELPRA